MTLSRKIALLGLTNLLLAGAGVFVFGRIHYGLGAESLLVGPASDRLRAIGDSFQLEMANGADPAELLQRLGRRYQAEAFLTDPDGGVLAGADPHLPLLMLERLKEDRGPGPPRPPRREDEEPGRNRKKKRGPPREPFFFLATSEPTAFWTVLRVPVRRGGESRPGVLFLRSTSLMNSELYFNWRPWLTLAAGLAGITLLCWWPFLRGLTRTIAQMDRATVQIARGNFDARVAGQRSDELGHLGAQINSMAQRLEDFVRSQKRFLGDTAHELSAPIARVQFALGILEQRVESDGGAATAQHVATLHEEVQEMSELVNELLSFSRIGMEPGITGREPLGLAGLVERAMAREAVTAPMQVDGALLVRAHQRYLLRAVANLLRNAQRYGGGVAGVRAWREGTHIVLVVEDDGPGLPPAALEQVFEPFYRLQSSRNRESGGVGLGLAIVKSCVEASGGTVSCRNRQPRGLEVRIVLEAIQ